MRAWLCKGFVLVCLSSVPWMALAKDSCGGDAFSEEAKPDVESHKIFTAWVKLAEKMLKIPSSQDMGVQLGMAPREISQVIGSKTNVVKNLRENEPELFARLQKEIAKRYATACKDYNRTITLEEFSKELGIEKKDLLAWLREDGEGLFKDVEELGLKAREQNPKAFATVINRNIFSPERDAKLLAAVGKRKRLVVTTAVDGAKVNLDFLASIQRYCEANDAELVVIPANMITNNLDPVLLDQPWIHIVTSETILHEHLRISGIKVTAKQIYPLTRLEGLGPRGQSVIVGSPKAHFKVQATADNNTLPHMLMTTGAITDPYYFGKRFISARTDYIATEEHQIGALILERTDGNENLAGNKLPYHIRRIGFSPKNRGFSDLNKFYSAENIDDGRPQALVFGDLHVASLDRDAFSRAKNMVTTFRPQSIVLHDIFDGMSVNHHIQGRQIERGIIAREGGDSVAAEVRRVIEVLNELLAADPEVEIVIDRANHDKWLDGWISSGAFMSDARNQQIGVEIARGLVSLGSASAIEYAVKSLPETAEGGDMIGLKLTDSSRVRFLADGERYTVEVDGKKVELGYHGHAGINGAKRISLESLQRATPFAIIGHTHTAAYLNRVMNVGTLTKLSLPYNKEGFSNWMQSVALVGVHGEFQLLVFSRGEFYSRRGNSKTRNFYDDTYPQIAPRPEMQGSDIGQIDQYSHF